MMNMIEKYVAPEVEILDLAVEQGFAASTGEFIEDEDGYG